MGIVRFLKLVSLRLGLLINFKLLKSARFLQALLATREFKTSKQCKESPGNIDEVNSNYTILRLDSCKSYINRYQLILTDGQAK